MNPTDRDFFALSTTITEFGKSGIAPSNQNKGSFVGKLIFNIVGNPNENARTGIVWNNVETPGGIVILDPNGNSIKSQCSFSTISDFTVTGITIISPNQPDQVIDRDKNYASLVVPYINSGYPIYFERSVNPLTYPVTSAVQVNDSIGYLFEYSMNNGNSWIEFGRVCESDKPSSAIGNNPNYRYGEIYTPNQSNGYIITSQDGAKLQSSNIRKPLRAIWARNDYFSQGSEESRLKITFLPGKTTASILSRNRGIQYDTTRNRLNIGRLFFLQLNGQKEYLRTTGNFNNSTQLTVEIWINLNDFQPVGSEPAIIASSGGPQALEIGGSKEGAWMLYLKDGRYPAFRAREMLGRGENGYIANIVTPEKFKLASKISDSSPLPDNYQANWTHLAATVNNDTVCLYIDGELVERYVNKDATDIRMLTTSHPLWVGVNPNISIDSSDFIHAGIKGLRVWKAALTQDQIRDRVCGIASPADVSLFKDIRRALMMYYPFEGNLFDAANDTTFQNGADELLSYESDTLCTSVLRFRPDRPHVRITSPREGSGITNKKS